MNELDRIRFSADINDFLEWFRIDAMAGDPRTGTTSSRNPFAIPLAVFRCFAYTFMPSMALHAVEFTFSRGFDSFRAHQTRGIRMPAQ